MKNQTGNNGPKLWSWNDQRGTERAVSALAHHSPHRSLLSPPPQLGWLLTIKLVLLFSSEKTCLIPCLFQSGGGGVRGITQVALRFSLPARFSHIVFLTPRSPWVCVRGDLIPPPPLTEGETEVRPVGGGLLAASPQSIYLALASDAKEKRPKKALARFVLRDKY